MLTYTVGAEPEKVTKGQKAAANVPSMTNVMSDIGVGQPATPQQVK